MVNLGIPLAYSYGDGSPGRPVGFHVSDTIYLNVIDVEIAPDSWLTVVLSDEKSLGEVMDKYMLEKMHIPEIEGLRASDLQQFHEDLIVQYLKGEKK